MRADELADALRQIADGTWTIPGPGHHTAATFARAVLDRHVREEDELRRAGFSEAFIDLATTDTDNPGRNVR